MRPISGLSKLPLTALSKLRRGKSTPDMSPDDAAMDDVISPPDQPDCDAARGAETRQATQNGRRRFFKLPFAGFGRKAATGTAGPQATDRAAPDAGKRFRLALPFARPGAGATPAASPVKIRVPDPAALQNLSLSNAEDAEATAGLAAKLQLMLARLMPAGREPRVFADRPDPFEKLAADAQRGSTR